MDTKILLNYFNKCKCLSHYFIIYMWSLLIFLPIKLVWWSKVGIIFPKLHNILKNNYLIISFSLCIVLSVTLWDFSIEDSVLHISEQLKFLWDLMVWAWWGQGCWVMWAFWGFSCIWTVSALWRGASLSRNENLSRIKFRSLCLREWYKVTYFWKYWKIYNPNRIIEIEKGIEIGSLNVTLWLALETKAIDLKIKQYIKCS